MKARQRAKASGRPRSFDTKKALDAAMNVFWRKGYEGASLSDLTKAMRINRPSLYAAFGDKKNLFGKVLDHYAEGPAAYVSEALKLPSARAVVERLLQGTADVTSRPGNPPGCLLVQGALVCGDGVEDIRNDLIRRRDAGERALLQRLRRAQREGDLPADVDAADLSSYIVTMIRGIAVQAASGATRPELQRIIRTALLAWPAVN